MRIACIVLALLAVHRPDTIAAQAIARTAAAAETEGGIIARANASGEQDGTPVRPFSGSRERRCVSAPPEGSLVNGAVRSGEVVARGRFSGTAGFRAGRPQKMLWIPLHARRGEVVPLLLRAARLEQPFDTLRQTIRSGNYSHGVMAYPSSIQLPISGDWLVVATAGVDWGCFVIHVGE